MLPSPSLGLPQFPKSPSKPTAYFERKMSSRGDDARMLCERVCFLVFRSDASSADCL